MRGADSTVGDTPARGASTSTGAEAKPDAWTSGAVVSGAAASGTDVSAAATASGRAAGAATAASATGADWAFGSEAGGSTAGRTGRKVSGSTYPWSSAVRRSPK